MKTEQATYTESQLQELIAKAIKQDREFQAQLLRAAPLPTADVKQGWIENPKFLTRQLESVLSPPAEEAASSAAQSPQILRLISGGKKVTIPACAGTRTIAESKALFTGYLDPAFEKLKKQETATPETDVEVYEMAENAKFTEMFGSLSTDLDLLVSTEDQVVTFCEKRRNWLRTDGYGTFFLLKNDGHFFVARVSVRDDGRLRVNLYRFGDDYVWGADYRRRVVAPQLKLGN